MSDNQTLEVTPQTPLNADNAEPSTPVDDVKPSTEEAEPKDDAGDKDGEKEPVKEEPKLTEAEKIRRAMQKRIDRQTAASKAMQERAERLEREIATYKTTAPKEDSGPKEADFNTWEEYEQARIEHLADKKVSERLKTEREKELKQLQERQLTETRQKFEEKEKSLRSTLKDYDAVSKDAVETMNALANAGNNIVGLRDAVMAFDNPPELIYQLGKDPDMIERLVTLSPLATMRELVKLESALRASSDSNGAEDKKPPEPIKGVSSRGGSRPLHERSGEDILKWVKGK